LRDTRKTKANRYGVLTTVLGELQATDAATFAAQRGKYQSWREEARNRDADLQNTLTEHGVTLRQGKQEHAQQSAEIDSLKRRRSNIDDQQIQVRAAICAALGLNVDDMPFAGELIQVREDERDWEGAAERLLRGFGLALLVPDAHYKAVAEWVDGAHLRGRLVYFHVRPRKAAELPDLHRDSLVASWPSSPTHRTTTGWSASWHRFDVACCATQEQFRRETRAITRMGQIKTRAAGTKRTTATASMTAAAMCWAGATAPRSPRWKPSAASLKRGWAMWAARSVRSRRNRMAWRERLDALSRLEEFTAFDSWTGPASPPKLPDCRTSVPGWSRHRTCSSS
jgi:uncharacterized protein YPO0396